MHISTLAMYMTAALAGALIPGPTSLLALANGISGNWRVVIAGMFGAAISDIIVIATVGLGLGALLAASATLFLIVKSVGVLYLGWLAFQLWRSQPAGLTTAPAAAEPRIARVFLRSFGVALTNPKILLFFSAFLPQFVDTSAPLGPQYAILAIASAGIDVGVMVLYATGGVHAARLLTSSGLRRLNRTCAVIMASLAAFLAFYRRAGAH
ncbi:LysE family translocator [Burkholderia sp. Bp8963]|uniref:LysE family translocator n=1 Tax=Burkholderia sp. Bp8963 TaxID=2184547 RepID=UPI000F590B5E|nr:LysE family translocator [Burkholderia sp. Bp8963]RQS62938.1 LysE family translocator [Burkholderia sp. Bp8963]